MNTYIFTLSSALHDKAPLYVGKKVFEFYENDVHGCYLSNNYVMIPYHCLEPSYTSVYEMEDVDLAIIKVDVVVTSLSTLWLQGIQCPLNGLQIKLYSENPVRDVKILSIGNPNEVGQQWWKDYPILFTFEFKDDLYPGDSGTTINGSFEIVQPGSRPGSRQILTFHSPLFMIIARSRTNYKNGLGLYLPSLLKMNRENDVDKSFVLPNITQLIADFNVKWELIRKPANWLRNELQRSINLMSLPAKNMKWETLMISESTETNEFDRAFLKMINNNKSQDEKLMDLYNAFLLFTVSGDVNDRCWTIQLEVEQGPSSSALYKKVANAMLVTDNITPLTVDSQGNIPPKTLIFSKSTIPIRIDNASYESFKIKTGDTYCYACHHPFLCELNRDCKGSIITHCCFRPSHLANMTKKFNDLCTILQILKPNGMMEFSWA